MGVAEEAEREQLVRRIERLRTVLPAFAEEVASARRQSAALRAENARLLERVRRLQGADGGRDRSAASST
jgi:hypothetical protein